VGQQARQQFFGYVVFLGAHCAYGQAGLRRRLIVRLHKILHTLNRAAGCYSNLVTYCDSQCNNRACLLLI
ncbi:hypothetical protein, partial [Comamonas sp. A23]|uniref:hypothetical protein n=1 Tax=Comamonas sp. A23 TaxID=2494248 RepID=UPI00196A7063